jgi:hypothetical protein
LDDDADPVELPSTVQIAPLIELGVRLLRWMDFPVSGDNDYWAEVIKEVDSFYYRARGVSVPITADEALQVISSPVLY